MKPMHLLLNVIFFLCYINYVEGINNPFPFIKRYTYCQFTECCDDNYIIGDTRKLDLLLQKKVYGQHIARNVVVHALSAHFTEKSPQKALTLSFHGWPGTGKNYVTRFIKETMYKEGAQSSFIHEFTARIHFPLQARVEEHKRNLQQWIKGNVTKCGRSLFIFDEVDKMPETLLNAIKPFIDYNDNVDKVDYRKSIFIFLSNTGGTIIKDHLLKLLKLGTKRNDIQLLDFESLITKGAFNELGGFHYCDTIKSNLIDHYIPFLPMERHHVELCIMDQFRIKGVTCASNNAINELMEYMEWGPAPLNLFSSTGCKRLSQKLPLVIHKYRLPSRNEL